MAVIHGGDTAAFIRDYGRPPLDFSASVTPFGMSPVARAAARAALDQPAAYPDPLCRDLAAALGERLGVSPDRMVFGNGAADVLQRIALALAPRAALLPVPAFGEYERALTLAGSRIEFCSLQPDTILDALIPGIDCLFLCQPNNPTSRALPPAALAALAARARDIGAALVVDECFRHFLDDPAAHTLIPRLRDQPRLIVVDSFTKLHGLAGLRLGYCLTGDPALAGRIRAAGPPWPVSTVAQAAGLAALADSEHLENTRRRLAAAKAQLLAGLAARDIEILGAEANFIFFRAAPDLARRLAAHGILIRDCASFRGLTPGHFRIAVRTPEDNERLLAALEEC